jgi:hypothetical protein
MTTSMDAKINEDLANMEKRLSMYVDKGRVPSAVEVREEPVTAIKPDKSLIKPLKKITSFDGLFLAVDCSTRTLKRANNWGIYLMRATYACVKERKVDWSYNERVCTVVGDASTRRGFLQDFRIEMESQMALSFLESGTFKQYYVPGDVRSMYLLLDGGGYFGGERKFRISLYEKCEADGINLLAISKSSPMLHDEKGRDLIATTYMLSPQGSWVYHPVRKADKDKSLYGDISIIKLREESPRVFRCDVMEYLTNGDVSEVISPLMLISEDPRCVGYPIVLWLAHDFSTPSDAKLIHYCEQVESTLKDAGLLDMLRREEFSCNFADELHGIRYPFQRESWGDYV